MESGNADAAAAWDGPHSVVHSDIPNIAKRGSADLPLSANARQ
ncbi:uncharacterized protein G2W53_011552 [Senna tora]|uniref:Uncharacterized protein n=1 Tax=Senna tora TaxID=362788 RepID=A0A834X1H6_9FABA|nr:uncharacterized protein G2W53_011552 [Senna tora]